MNAPYFVVVPESVIRGRAQVPRAANVAWARACYRAARIARRMARQALVQGDGKTAHEYFLQMIGLRRAAMHWRLGARTQRRCA